MTKWTRDLLIGCCIIAVAFALKIVWAKIVYGRAACAFAECRIEVKP